MFITVAYLIKIVFKFLMRRESFSGRCIIHFQRDLPITSPQIFYIDHPLVFLDSSEEPFSVVGQGFIYVDLTISSACFSERLRTQMACVLSNQILSLLVDFLSVISL